MDAVPIAHEQLEAIRRYSKDEASFLELVKLFQSLLHKTQPTDDFSRRVDISPDSAVAGAIFDTVASLVVVLDTEGRILRINDACENLTGYQSDDVRGQYVWDVLSPKQDVERAKRYLVSIGDGQRPTGAISQWRTRHGKLRLVEWQAQIIATNQQKYIVWSGHDITEQRQTEAALRASQNRYLLLMTHMNEGLIIEGPNGLMTFVNPKLCDFLGYTQSELVKRPMVNFLTAEGTATYLEQMERCRQGESGTYELVWQRKDGEKLWTIASTAPILKEDKQYQGSISIITNITERKRAGAALEASEAQYRWLVNHMNDGLSMHDADGVISFVNPRHCEMLGYEEADLKGKQISSFLAPESKTTHDEHMQRYRRGQSTTYEAIWIRQDGERLWTLVSGEPIHENGVFKGCLNVLTDITDRVKAEEALRASEERYRQLLEVSPQVVMVHHAGVIEFINQTGAELLGFIAPSQAIGQSIFDFIPKESHEEMRRRIDRVQLGGEALEAIEQRWVRADGSTVDVEVQAVPVFFNNQIMSQVIASDISERVRAREALQASEKRLRDITATLGQGVYVLDHRGNLVFMNPEAERLLGWNEAELLNKQAQPIFHPNHTESDDPMLKAVNAGQTYRSQDDTFVRRDGTEMPVSYVSTPLMENGVVTGSVTVFQDITERKQTEVEREKLIAELDAFSGMVAHDLKGPLQIIIGNAQILENFGTTIDQNKLQVQLHSIVSNALKLDTIIDELLVLAGIRAADVKLTVLDMGHIVAEAQKRIVYVVEEYDSEIIVPHTWPKALGHAPWIEEVWANYLSNGLKYGGRPARLKLGATEQDDGFVRFWIKDNGQGISAEDQKQLFRPFTRLNTDIRAKGHGLGLSIVRRIIEKLGGTVGVESTPGQGSTFYFTLPRAK